jgi:multidrug resistance efflux pump
MHLKIETAVVTVPLETIVAPTTGLIKEIFVTPGQEVKKNTPLLRIENFELERDLQLARIQAEDARLNIHYLQNLLANEQQRLNLYKDIGSNRVISAQAAVDEAKHELMTTEKQLQRMRLLQKKHFVSNMEFDEALAKYQRAQEKIKSAIALKDLENNSLNAVEKGVYFTGTKLEGISGDINAQIQEAQNKLKLSEDRVQVYENILNKLTLLAPFDGKINQVLKTAGTATDTVKPILLLEKTEAQKQVVAYLTQDEVTHIGSRNRVKIYVPSLGKTYHGRVAEINRTAGFIDEVKAQYRWRDFQTDRSAMVSIDLETKSHQLDSILAAGMPAIVYFSRKYTVL